MSPGEVRDFFFDNSTADDVGMAEDLVSGHIYELGAIRNTKVGALRLLSAAV